MSAKNSLKSEEEKTREIIELQMTVSKYEKEIKQEKKANKNLETHIKILRDQLVLCFLSILMNC